MAGDSRAITQPESRPGVELPEGSTAASAERLTLAREIVRSCPEELGSEIALTGSAARGMADEDSDIELNLWTKTLPDATRRGDWLRSIAEEVTLDTNTMGFDGSVWSICRVRGVWVEVGWGTVERTSRCVEELVSAQTSAHRDMVFGSILSKAVPLRSGGHIERWQEALRQYPEELRARIIRENTSAWSDPHVPGVRWALARRNARMALAQRLIWDMQNVLAVLFALNRTWEPDFKWTDERSLALPVKPDRLSERINEVFVLTDPEKSIVTAFELILDTLDLAAGEFDVSVARSSVVEALEGRLSG